MIKTALIAIFTPTLIKAVSEGYDWMCEAFGCEDELEAKRPDRTILNAGMRKRINAEYRFYLKNRTTVNGLKLHNLQDLTNYLNDELGLNKSKSTYANVWRLNK